MNKPIRSQVEVGFEIAIVGLVWPEGPLLANASNLLAKPETFEAGAIERID